MRDVEESRSFWSTESFHIRLRRQDTTTSHLFRQPFALLGRHANCDLVLDHRSIESRSLIVLLGSTNTYAVVLQPEAKRAGRPFIFAPGRAFRLGGYEVEVQRDIPLPAAPEACIHTEPVYVLTWKRRGTRLHIQLPHDRPILLGRHAHATAMVDDASMSATHACLYRLHDGLWVTDLCSSNGTFAHGHRVRATHIPCGSSFKAGHTRFHFLALHRAEELAASREAHTSTTNQWESARDTWNQHRAELLKSLAQLAEHAAGSKAQLQAETELLVARITELESDLASCHQERQRIDNAHEELRADHAVLHEQLTQQALTQEELQRKLSEQSMELQHRAEALEKLDTELSLRSSELAEHVSSEEQLQAKLSDQSVELQHRADTVNKLETELSSRTREVAELWEALHEQQSETKQLRQRLEQTLASQPSSVASFGESQDETCISSPHFAEILTEAIERERLL